MFSHHCRTLYDRQQVPLYTFSGDVWSALIAFRAAGDFIDTFVANGGGSQDWFAVDSDGDLYVSGHDVRKFDGETGAFITRFGGGGRIAIGPDDNLYCLSNDRVTRYDSDTGQLIFE